MEFPVPTEDAVNRAMLTAWQTQGELLLQHCSACGAVTYYPRKRCPACWSAKLTDKASTGLGSVVSFSIIHRPVEEVFRQQDSAVTLAVVATDDGPQLITRIVGDAFGRVEIGSRVELYEGEDRATYPLPVYRLVTTQTSAT